MELSGTYKYHLRPGYDSGNLLIEFISGVEKVSFEPDLFEALKKLEPLLIEQQDLWMNDETLFLLESNVGSFSISKDIWDLAFIMSEDQNCIVKINELLLTDQKFEMIDVDHKKYRKEETDSD